MDITQKEKAEKLQTRLDKLLQTREKKQATFNKAKLELTEVTKEIGTVKFKLFEILQSGSDDSAFSIWAKEKINKNFKNEKNEKSENDKTENSKKSNSQNQKIINEEEQESNNNKTHIEQNQLQHTG